MSLPSEGFMDRSKKNYDHFDNDDDDTDDDIGNYENKFDIHFRATTWPCGIMTKGPQYIW